VPTEPDGEDVEVATSIGVINVVTEVVDGPDPAIKASDETVSDCNVIGLRGKLSVFIAPDNVAFVLVLPALTTLNAPSSLSLS
jgi:hypothetical protein